MNSKEISEMIERVARKNRGAMPPSIVHQVEAQDQNTLALLEISRQVALGREANQLDGVTHTATVARALAAIVKELAALRSVVDTFGLGVIQLPASTFTEAEGMREEDFTGGEPR